MRVIGYIRVSTNNQDLHRQCDKVRDFCKKQGYTLVRLIEDFAISGKTNDRVGYKELISLTANDCDMVVVSEISRLSRQDEIAYTLADIQTVVSNGMDLLLLDQPSKVYEKNKPLPIQDLVLLLVGLWGAAKERKEILTKMQDGKISKYKANPYALIDGKVPYGFKKINNPNGNFPKYLIEENPEEVAIIKKIFELVLKGKTLYNVMSYLIARNITIRGTVPNEAKLSKLVKNQLYRGIRHRKRKTGNSEERLIQYINPIISEADFNKAQERVKSNLTTDTRDTKYFNPLRGIMKCRCGRSMTIKDKKTEGITKLVYRCSCNEVRNSPNFCKVNIDEVSYNYTLEVTKCLFKQKHIEIKKYLESKGNEKEQAIIEILRGLDERIYNKGREIEIKQKDIDLNIQKLLNTSNPTFIAALEQQQLKLDKALEDAKSNFNFLHSERVQLLNKLEDVRSMYEMDLDVRANNLQDEDLPDIYHTFLDKVEYYKITTMKGFYKYYFKSGQIIYVAISKVASCPKAVVIDAKVNTENGDITFKYYSAPVAKSITDFNLGEFKEVTINITDKGFFTSEWLEYAFATELDIDLSWRKDFSEKVKAQGGYKQRDALRKKK